jgi:hypothetical protein
MSIRCLVLALAVGLTGLVSRATAQQPAAPADSARAELQSTLRAFYFNLAHQDWGALSAYILPAKVVAHRPAPDAIVVASTRPPNGVLPTASASANDAPTCSNANEAPVDNAVILLRGDWAEVSVARCGAAAGADQFRLIHFEARWWIVFIDLFRAPPAVQVAR